MKKVVLVGSVISNLISRCLKRQWWAFCSFVLVAQVCLTLCDPTDCNQPGSSIHDILQAKILEWVAISSSRGPPLLRA